jgi:hypothetical protein
VEENLAKGGAVNPARLKYCISVMCNLFSIKYILKE